MRSRPLRLAHQPSARPSPTSRCGSKVTRSWRRSWPLASPTKRQATVVRAEHNYEGKHWVAYDRQYRREALARRDLNWSVTDLQLYNETFTGRAKAIARCSVCLADDHTDSLCPRNPNRPVFGWLPETHYWPPPGLQGQQTSRPRHIRGRRRRRPANEGRCNRKRCKYSHHCSSCGGTHAALRCPANGTAGRSRSPTGPLPGASRRF